MDDGHARHQPLVSRGLLIIILPEAMAGNATCVGMVKIHAWPVTRRFFLYLCGF
jgi:hypothetical protein